MKSIRVEVVDARPGGAQVEALILPAGSTLADALAGRRLPAGAKPGVFGRVVPATTRLEDGDRVEIYRPLAIDPKEARRRRAAQRQGRSRGRR